MTYNDRKMLKYTRKDLIFFDKFLLNPNMQQITPMTSDKEIWRQGIKVGESRQ